VPSWEADESDDATEQYDQGEEEKRKVPDVPRQARAFQNRYDHPGDKKARGANDENPGNEQIQEPEFRSVRQAESTQIVGHGWETNRILVLRQTASNGHV
jgi:hypothetical protein